MPSADRILERQEREIGTGASRIMPRNTYSTTIYENDKYNVKGYSYPNDLMETTDYGENRVIFYINVSVDSRVFKTEEGIGTVDDVQRDQRGELVGQNVTTAQAETAAGTAGAITGALGGKLFFDKGKSGAVAGGVLGAGGAALISSNVSNTGNQTAFSRPQKRLQAAIALYIPNQLSIRYSAGWSEEETVGFSAAAQGAGEILRAFEADVNLKRTGGIAQSVLTSAALGGFGASPVPFATAMGIGAGLAANPKKEQAFKNVDFRTFTFDYQFSPRSEEEAKNVMNIIQAFKYHMHPEFKSPDNFLYIYPSEFDIVYYKGTTENIKIHRHTSCVLTEMNVNYTPNGVFTTFPDGTPTQINVSLTFKELMLLTKEAIERYA